MILILENQWLHVQPSHCRKHDESLAGHQISEYGNSAENHS